MEPFTCLLAVKGKPVKHTFTPIDAGRWRVTRERSAWDCRVEPDSNSCTCTAGQFRSGCNHLRELRRHLHEQVAKV